MLGNILLIVLIALLIGGLPRWGYSREWGYRPTQLISVLLAILLICMIMGVLPVGF